MKLMKQWYDLEYARSKCEMWATDRRKKMTKSENMLTRRKGKREKVYAQQIVLQVISRNGCHTSIYMDNNGQNYLCLVPSSEYACYGSNYVTLHNA